MRKHEKHLKNTDISLQKQTQNYITEQLQKNSFKAAWKTIQHRSEAPTIFQQQFMLITVI